MAEDEDDDWEGREGRWTRGSESSGAGSSDGERYYELPDGEVVQGPPPDDVEAEPVEAPAEDEEEGGGLAGLFGGDGDDDDEDEELDEPEEDEEDEDSSIVPLVAGIVVLLLVLLVLLVAAAYAGIADPLGIGSSLPGAGGGDDGGDDGGNGGGNGMNETELFSYPVNWTESSFTVNNQSDGVAMMTGEKNETEFSLDRSNLTQVSFTLTWVDDDDVGTGPVTQNDPDTLELNVTSPAGELVSESSEAREGEITITFDFGSVPTSPTEIVADSRSNATGQLLDEHPVRTNGTGTYTITVRYVSGGNTCPEDGTVGTDCREDWTLDVSYGWYEGLLGEPVKVQG